MDETEHGQLFKLKEMCKNTDFDKVPLLLDYMEIIDNNMTRHVAIQFVEESSLLALLGALCIVLGILGAILNLATFSYYCKVKKKLFGTAYRSLTMCDLVNCFAAIFMGCNLACFISWDSLSLEGRSRGIIFSKFVVAISSLMSRIAVWNNLILTILRTQTVMTPSRSMSPTLLQWMLTVQPSCWVLISIADISLQYVTELPILFHIRYDVIKPMLGRITIIEIGISMCVFPHPLLIWFLTLVVPFIIPVLIAFPLMIGQVYCLMFRNRQISSKSVRSKKMTVTIIYLTLVYIVSNSVYAIAIAFINEKYTEGLFFENYLFITSTIIPYLHSTINAGILIGRGNSLQNHCMGLFDQYLWWWRRVETPVREVEEERESNRNMTTCMQEGEQIVRSACPMNPVSPTPFPQKSRQSSL